MRIVAIRRGGLRGVESLHGRAGLFPSIIHAWDKRNATNNANALHSG